MRNAIASVVAAVLIAGCASAGQKFSIESANTVTNGMTREQVIEVMGSKPSTVTNQGKVFVWSYAKVGILGGTSSRAVKFQFDDDGKTFGIPPGGVYGDTSKYVD